MHTETLLFTERKCGYVSTNIVNGIRKEVLFVSIFYVSYVSQMIRLFYSENPFSLPHCKDSDTNIMKGERITYVC